MSPRTVPTDLHARRGRLAKAHQFAEAAEIVRALADGQADLLDAYVTLCVHSGVASSDVICAAALGVRSRGENHTDAVALLRQVDRDLARHLDVLLGMKTQAGYGHESVTPERAVRAGRAMDALLRAAEAAG